MREVILELYARPPAEVAATFLVLGIIAGKMGAR